MDSAESCEDYFGTPLFERRPRHALTDAGQLVLRHSRDTLHDFARLRGDIDNLRGAQRPGDHHLDSLTVHFLPEAMARFVAAHPAVQIRVVALDPVETMHSVAQGHADLGLTFSPARRRGVSLLADAPSPMCAIMAHDHELAARSSLTLDECGTSRLLYQELDAALLRIRMHAAVLRYFEAVAEEGSIRRASERLHISPVPPSTGRS